MQAFPRTCALYINLNYFQIELFFRKHAVRGIQTKLHNCPTGRWAHFAHEPTVADNFPPKRMPVTRRRSAAAAAAPDENVSEQTLSRSGKKVWKPEMKSLLFILRAHSVHLYTASYVFFVFLSRPAAINCIELALIQIAECIDCP